ncbi:MAG: hypothetical protein II998_01350 [Clostridia bacterium]|nr:hypothetical protein [Clostridia bacterium]
MIKTETTDNLCLVSVNTIGGCSTAMNIINAFLEKKGLFPVFLSGGDALGKGDKIFVAVADEEVFTLMNVLGSIRQDAGIKNYSINCSNSMIKWTGTKERSTKVLSKVDFDIKLAVLSDNDGICFCDTVHRKKLCSMLNSKIV